MNTIVARALQLNPLKEISPIGLGAWAIGGAYKYGWGPTDDNESIRAIRTSVECGSNWIDTAAVYGFGHSETVVGEALTGIRDQVFIATKGGLIRQFDDSLKRDLSRQTLFDEVDGSLRRLNTDRIDLYQTHWPDTETPIEETWSAMSDIVRAGKARFIGVSNPDPSALDKMHSIHPLYAVQVPYNVLRRDIEREIIPFCKEKGVRVLAYSPMQSGLLTGKFAISNLASDDWRRRKTEWFGEPNLTKYLSIVEKLRVLAVSLGLTVGHLAVAWVLSKPSIAGAIVGARSESQVRSNLDAQDLRLTSEQMRVVEHIVEDAEKGIEQQ